MRRAVVLAVLTGALIAAPPAGALTGLPWTWNIAEFEVAQNDAFIVTMNNLAGTPQTYTVAGVTGSNVGTENHAISANVDAVVSGTCTTTGGCLEIPFIQTSSPDVQPTIVTTLENGSTATAAIIGPGQFGLIGPQGTLDDVLAALTTSSQNAFGSLESMGTNLVATLGGTAATVNGTAATVSATSAALGGVGAQTADAATQAQVTSLEGQVKTLTTDVTKLTTLVKKLEPKPKKKTTSKHKTSTKHKT